MPGRVLIETLWNVKIINTGVAISHPSVLIETLWNVKTGGAVGAISLAIGINRNIVECKARGGDLRSLRFAVLIETLWNVKWNVPTPFGTKRMY